MTAITPELALKIRVARQMLSERRSALHRAMRTTAKAKDKVASIEAKLRVAKDALVQAQEVQSEHQRRVWTQWDYIEREKITEEVTNGAKR